MIPRYRQQARLFMNTTDTGMGSDVEQVTDQYVVVLIIRVFPISEMRASECKM